MFPANSIKITHLTDYSHYYVFKLWLFASYATWYCDCGLKIYVHVPLSYLELLLLTHFVLSVPSCAATACLFFFKSKQENVHPLNFIHHKNQIPYYHMHSLILISSHYSCVDLIVNNLVQLLFCITGSWLSLARKDGKAQLLIFLCILARP